VDDRSAGDPWDHALGASDGLVAGGASSLGARLDAWLADARVEGSADARARERWLRAAADADATFSGILLDLAERGAAISVATVAGRRLQGVVAVLGADFVSMRSVSGGEVLVALATISSVRTAPPVDRASGERVVTTDLRLGDVLGELASERARVRLVLLDGSEAVAGELRSVGQDVVTLRTDGQDPATAYARTDAIAEVTLG
jgi:hypothetical protein